MLDSYYNMNRVELRNKAKQLQPSVRIGKFGINEAAVEEIKRQLKAKKLVKVKLLKNAEVEDVDAVAEGLAGKTDSALIDRVGRVVVLYKS